MKKPVPKTASPEEAKAKAEVPKLLVKLPLTADLLLSPTWEDGDPKGDTCLFIFPSGPLVKLLVKIGNPPLKLMVPGRTWDEAWAALETILKGDDVPWETDGGPAGPAKRKRKGGG